MKVLMNSSKFEWRTMCWQPLRQTVREEVPVLGLEAVLPPVAELLLVEVRVAVAEPWRVDMGAVFTIWPS